MTQPSGADRATRRSPAPHTKAGPQRSEAARVAVLHAADDLLLDVGFNGMTIGAIAERAGVAKQTVYRWWRSKGDILLDVLEEDLQDESTWPQTRNDPGSALEEHVTHTNTVFSHMSTGRVLFALVGCALQDPTQADALRAGVLVRQRERDIEGISGILAALPHLPSDRAAADTLLDLMVGPLFYRAFVAGMPTDPDVARELPAIALSSLT
ncbi:TetR/AcrR family transcriptional regulator [Streptomyces sp. NBC_01351]